MRLKVKLVTGNGTGTSGNWKKKLRNLVRQTPEAQAGFTADATYPSGINVAYVAYIQNKGIGGVPERPFMQSTVDEQQNKWSKQLTALLKGKSAQNGALLNAYTAVSKEMKADIQDTIKKWEWNDPRPNSPATIRMKQRKAQSGKNAVATDPYRALIDTSTMINAVTNNVKVK